MFVRPAKIPCQAFKYENPAMLFDGCVFGQKTETCTPLIFLLQMFLFPEKPQQVLTSNNPTLKAETDRVCCESDI